MFYFIKDLEWSKAKGQDLFYAEGDYSCGKSGIIHAGIFSEEDKEVLLFKQKIEEGTIEFIPITKDIEKVIVARIQKQAYEKIKEFQKYVVKE
ncbi:hypothetical protein [Clostridium tertium]|uniref:hypothetical protein n=1 Tax=Clostridium tertium TaxID=1559 RepID=UPI0023B2E92E|nr:hypothetical protein [Clostridium tertium]